MIDFHTLSDEQKLAFHVISRHIMHFNPNRDKNPVVLDANAGSGKSTVIRAVGDHIAAHTAFTVTAFTGRACSQIQKSGGSLASNTSTCHALLKKAVTDFEGNLIRWEDRTNKEVREAIGKGVIIDEGSMIPHEMYTKLMSLNIPVVVVGDNAQLPSIEPNATEGFNAMKEDGNHLTLTRNFRQEGGSAIADLCMHLRENNTIPRRKADDLSMTLKSQAFKLGYHIKNEFDAVICGTNKSRKKLNNLIRNARGYHEEIPEVGETILCKRNDMVNNIKINNGELFRVDGIFEEEEVSMFYLTGMDSDKKVTVRVPNETWITEQCDRKFKGKPVQLFTFGYAMTCHSAQGSQFDSVLYIDEDVSFFLDQQKFRYTAVSRAAKKLTICI